MKGGLLESKRRPFAKVLTSSMLQKGKQTRRYLRFSRLLFLFPCDMLVVRRGEPRRVLEYPAEVAPRLEAHALCYGFERHVAVYVGVRQSSARLLYPAVIQ